MIRISKAHPFEPAPFTVLGWEVNDIQSKVDELSERAYFSSVFQDLNKTRAGLPHFLTGLKYAGLRIPTRISYRSRSINSTTAA